MLTFCFGTCDVSTLVGITRHNIYIFQVLECKQLCNFFFFKRLLFFLLLNITFVKLQDNTSFEKGGFIIKYHFISIFEKGKFHACLGNSETTGLKYIRSYPVKTLYIHYRARIIYSPTVLVQMGLMNDILCLYGPSLLASSYHLAVELVMCPLWLG